MPQKNKKYGFKSRKKLKTMLTMGGEASWVGERCRTWIQLPPSDVDGLERSEAD
jgi:hypothetical protein